VRAALVVFDGHLGIGVDLALDDARGGFGLGERERKAVDRGEVARDADVAERVGAVRQDVDLEDRVARGGHGAEKGCAGLGGPFGEHEDAVVAARPRRGEAHFALRAEHAFALHAADLARADRHPLGHEMRAERGQHDEPARIGDVRRAAHDALFSSAAVDRDELEARTARVLFDLAHGCHDERLETDAVLVQPLDFQAGVGEALGDFRGRGIEPGNQGAQPAVRGFHRSGRFYHAGRPSAPPRGRGGARAGGSLTVET
jgi:hypothetical protein